MRGYSLVSIIVPVYKAEKYLDLCVQSLVNQTYKEIEIILVDDGSPDNCGAICDAWADRDSRISVIHKTNGGVSDARNVGIKAAKGWWLIFVDSDDVVSPYHAEGLVKASVEKENCLAVSSVERFVDALPDNKGNYRITDQCKKNLPVIRGGMYACGALYNRRLIETIELEFDSALHNVEDVVWNGIYLRYVSEMVYVDAPYYYRINPTSITSKCGDFKWQINSWIAARKSIMNWFADKSLTESQRKEVAGMYRHCQNNIYAECVAGKISWAALQELEKKPEAQFCEMFMVGPERFIRNYLPQLYFGVYTLLIRVKNAIRR